MDITHLRSQFPDRTLLIQAIRSTAPLEAEWLDDVSASDETIYESAAALVDALQLNLSLESTLATIARDAGIERIQGHHEFFTACCDELRRSQSLRLTLVGPTFLEPLWLRDRDAQTNPRPDFTRELRERLFTRTIAPCEIILRNNPVRYEANLREFVAGTDEFAHLIDGMLADSFELFGDQGEFGPRIRCIDPGYSHLPHLFDNVVLVGTRRSPNERVAGGWRMTDSATVAAERERWSELFGYGGTQAEAVASLRSFIETLRLGG